MFIFVLLLESLQMSPPVAGALWREVCERGITIIGNTIWQGFDLGIDIYFIQHNPTEYPSPY